MKIAKIQIQKFRSINNISIAMDQITAIVGANNAGKSHILRALNAFFNFSDERNAFLSQDHLYSAHSRPRITVSFNDIKEEDQIRAEYIYNGVLTIRFTYRWDRNNPSYDVMVGNQVRNLNVDEFRTLISHFHYIYVPIVRSYENAITGNNGIAFDLLKSVYSVQVSNRNTIRPHIDQLNNKIKSTIFKSAVEEIKKYYPLGNALFSIEQTASDEVIDLILKSASLYLTENEQKNEIRNCGSGIQSAIYFAICMASSMDDKANYLIGIEEPELNMHPQAQRKLIEALKNKDKFHQAQFILTTHSTVIIDKLGHSSIVLCRKNRGETRNIITTVTQIPADFWEKYNFTEERYYSFYHYKNSDFFFSNYIIITESPADCSIIESLLHKSHIDVEEQAISLIPADGEKNIKYPYALAKELGIPFLCIVDRDVFQAYANDKRKNSLDEDGIPIYKNEKKSSSPIYGLISTEDGNKIANAFINGKYNDALSVLQKYHIVSMRYAIEVDLAICNSYREAFCDILQISEENRTSAYLLKNMEKRIKDRNVITEAIKRVPSKNLPKSYKQILSCVKTMVHEKPE